MFQCHKNFFSRNWQGPLYESVRDNDMSRFNEIINDPTAAKDLPLVEQWIWGPFHHAAYAGRLEMVSKMLTMGVKVDGMSQHGESALMFAAEGGHEAVMEMLIDRGANVNFIRRDGGTALIAAARVGYPACVSRLLKAGANINFTDNKGKTAKDWARERNNVECVRLLEQF